MLAYHERTKHYPGRFARALGHMDWATQPDPFRRFAGRPLLSLDLVPCRGPAPLRAGLFPGEHPARAARSPLGIAAVSGFAGALGVEAGRRRALVAAGQPVEREPPSDRGLSRSRAPWRDSPTSQPSTTTRPTSTRSNGARTCSDETWAALATQLPPGSVLVGLTSIHWRESWKYGERAFRYCQHDVGHAMGAVAVAAAGLGWEARLCEGVTDSDLARLLGRRQLRAGPRPSMPTVCWRVSPQDAPLSIEQQRAFTLSDDARRSWAIAQRSPSRRRDPRARSGRPMARRPQPPQPRARAALARDRRGGGGDPQDEAAARRLLGRTPTLVNHSPRRRRFAPDLAPDPAAAAERGRARRPHRSYAAKPSSRSCSRPFRARVKSPSRRCRGGPASTCCCSFIGWRAFRLAFTSFCAIRRARRPWRG